MAVPPSRALTWLLDADGGVVAGGDPPRILNLKTTSGTASSSTQWMGNNTNDNLGFTFIPNLSSTSLPPSSIGTFQGYGWAISDSNSTPDDTRCRTLVHAQTVAVTVEAAVAWAGIPIGSATGQTASADFFAYHLDTGATVHLGGATSAFPQSWGAVGTPNTGYQVAALNVAISQRLLDRRELLTVAISFNTGTLPNPAVGTNTYTISLRINGASNSRLGLTTALVAQCATSDTSSAVGVSAKVVTVRGARAASAVGTANSSRYWEAYRTQSPVGVGATTRTLKVSGQRVVGGIGTSSRTARVRLTRPINGIGTTTRNATTLRTTRPVPGVGAPAKASAHSTLAPKSVAGVSAPQFLRSVIFSRSFTVAGRGQLAGTILLPIERLPDAGNPTVIKKIFPVFG